MTASGLVLALLFVAASTAAAMAPAVFVEHRSGASGWIALPAPACIAWLPPRLSGLPPLEAHILAGHGEACRRRTGVPMPLPSKG